MSKKCRKHSLWAWAATLLVATTCAPTLPPRPVFNFDIQFDHYTLENGLSVVLHEDHSNPIITVATLVHAGSSRQPVDRTGLAHLFKQLSLSNSENVPQGTSFQLVPELGGTWGSIAGPDTTTYYEVVPKDALEKVLWLNSDRLGYTIATASQENLKREQVIVRSKRQLVVENISYGHTQAVQHAALYPVGHPYRGTIFGTPEHLQDATVSNLQSFYQRFYGAANTTLVIAGDIDIEPTKQLVEYWFGEIRRGPDISSPYPQPVYLEKSQSLMYEDKLAKLPELQIVFPTVEQFHKDHYALELLSKSLAGRKRAPLNESVIQEGQLAQEVTVSHQVGEIAGKLVIRVRANADVDLDEVKEAVEEGLERFDSVGIDAVELELKKIQTGLEWQERLANIIDKSLMLARFTAFTGDPRFFHSVIKRTLAVTTQDVFQVYERYLKNRRSVMTSFVPLGRADLAVAGAQPINVIEENVDWGCEEITPTRARDYYRTFTEADRSEPPLGDLPGLSTPQIWQTRQTNGLEVYGIEVTEEPLAAFELILPGGQLLEPPGKTGVASFLASLLTESTSDKTPTELEEALDLLGARITIKAEQEVIRLSGLTPSQMFEPTIVLVQELLLSPNWDKTLVARLKREHATHLLDKASNLAMVADTAFHQVVYGKDHPFGIPVSGTPATIANIEIDDLRHYYAQNVTPTRASFHVAGAVSQARVEASLANLSKHWPSKQIEIPTQPVPPKIEGQTIYLVDVPAAKQSLVRVGLLVPSADESTQNLLNYANKYFGGGSNSRLFQQLGIERAYTFEATSEFLSTRHTAAWLVRVSIRTETTTELLKLLRELIRNYSADFTEEDLRLTKTQILKHKLLIPESLQGKMDLLNQIGRTGLSLEALSQREEAFLAMDVDTFKEAIETYLNESQMIYIVVGNAKTLLSQMTELGYGEPVMLDTYGQRR